MKFDEDFLREKQNIMCNLALNLTNHYGVFCKTLKTNSKLHNKS